MALYWLTFVLFLLYREGKKKREEKENILLHPAHPFVKSPVSTLLVDNATLCLEKSQDKALAQSVGLFVCTKRKADELYSLLNRYMTESKSRKERDVL